MQKWIRWKYPGWPNAISVDLAIVAAIVRIVILVEFVEHVQPKERADYRASGRRRPADAAFHRTRAAAFRDFNGLRLRPNVHGESQFRYQRLPWSDLQERRRKMVSCPGHRLIKSTSFIPRRVSPSQWTLLPFAAPPLFFPPFFPVGFVSIFFFIMAWKNHHSLSDRSFLSRNCTRALLNSALRGRRRGLHRVQNYANRGLMGPEHVDAPVRRCY